MADENSLYNISEWSDPNEGNNTSKYAKDDIVVVFERFASSKIPKNATYYYSTSDNNIYEPSPDSIAWGGITVRNNKNKPKFIWKPSYNIGIAHEPRTNNIVFGNGYEQRFQDGIFNDLITISLAFELRDIKETKAINHFLKTRKSVESFVFEDLPEPHNDLKIGGYRKLFVCKSWRSEFKFYNNYTISAEFVQVNT